MYRWRYDKLPAALPPATTLQVLAGDTDSFFVRVEGVTRLAFEQRLCELGYLDSSNFPSDHPLFSNDRRAKLGCVKNEYPNKCMQHMIFIRPKVYMLQAYEDARPTKITAKGVNRAARYTLTLNDFIDAVCMKEVQRNQVSIVSKLHQVMTTSTSKWVLSSTDNKRAWVDDEVSLPYGHKRLRIQYYPDHDAV
jgi:hypothetical protein